MIRIPKVFATGGVMKSKLVNIPSVIIGFVVGVLFLISCGGRNSQVNVASAATPVDQLICPVFGTWILDGTAFPCIQASNPSGPRSLTMPQILQEGWTAISAGGGDGSNRIVLVFHK
jgi:hypothetical protein